MIYSVAVIVSLFLTGLVRVTNGDMVETWGDLAVVFAYFVAVTSALTTFVVVVS